MTIEDPTKRWSILARLAMQYRNPVDLSPLIDEESHLSSPTQMDVEQSFLPPVPAKKSLDNLKAPTEGSDSVE